MANNVKRMIKEEGIVLERILKPATNEFKGSDGRVVPAQPERHILKCVSGEEFNKNDGYMQSTVLEYKVEKTIFDKVVFATPVVVKYEVSSFGAKANSVQLKDNE